MARNFIDEFRDALEGIESGAREAGSSLTTICRRAGISRTTPDRWRANVPATVALVARLQDEVERVKAEKRESERDAA